MTTFDKVNMWVAQESFSQVNLRLSFGSFLYFGSFWRVTACHAWATIPIFWGAQSVPFGLERSKSEGERQERERERERDKLKTNDG